MKYEKDLNLSAWFTLCIVSALVLAGLFGIGSCMNKDMEKRDQWRKENPVDAAKDRCYSKIQGSRPACWSEGDKIIFRELLKEQIKPVVQEVIKEEISNYVECYQ